MQVLRKTFLDTATKVKDEFCVCDDSPVEQFICLRVRFHINLRVNAPDRIPQPRHAIVIHDCFVSLAPTLGNVNEQLRIFRCQ